MGDGTGLELTVARPHQPKTSAPARARPTLYIYKRMNVQFGYIYLINRPVPRRAMFGPGTETDRAVNAPWAR